MLTSERQIFRNKAVQHHIYGKEKDILPRFSTISTSVFLWALLTVCLFAGFFAWSAEIPVYASGPGVVLSQSSQLQLPGSTAAALIFLSPSQRASLHVGQSAQLQFGTQGSPINGKITRVLPGTISPADICAEYRTTCTSAALITQPALAVLVDLGSGISSTMYAGSLLSAQVTIGSQRILSLLSGIGG